MPAIKSLTDVSSADELRDSMLSDGYADPLEQTDSELQSEAIWSLRMLRDTEEGGFRPSLPSLYALARAKDGTIPLPGNPDSFGYQLIAEAKAPSEASPTPEPEMASTPNLDRPEYDFHRADGPTQPFGTIPGYVTVKPSPTPTATDSTDEFKLRNARFIDSESRGIASNRTNNPFADLIPPDFIGGEDGAPAFQTIGAKFEQVPRASLVTPNAFADLIPSQPDPGAFQDLIPPPPPQADLTSATEQAVSESAFNPRNEQISEPPDFLDELVAGNIKSAYLTAKNYIGRALEPTQKIEPGRGQGLLGTEEQIPAHPDDSLMTRAAKAVVNVTNRTAAGLSGPGMLPLAVIGGAGGATGRLLSAGFGATVAANVPDVIQNIVEKNKANPMSQAAIEADLDGAVTALMLGGAAKGARGEPARPASASEPAPVTETPVAPETAAGPEPVATAEAAGVQSPEQTSIPQPQVVGDNLPGSLPADAVTPEAAQPDITPPAPPVQPEGWQMPENIEPGTTAAIAELERQLGPSEPPAAPEIFPTRASPESGLPEGFTSVGASTGVDIPEPTKISIAKEKVNQRRAFEGNLPVFDEHPAANAATYAEAERRIAENRDYGSNILNDLRDGTRTSVDHVEEAALMHEAVTIRNQREAAAVRAGDIHASEADRAIAHTEWQAAEDRLNELDQATKLAGQSAARVLQLRKAQIADDYTFAGIERNMRAAKQRPLTPEESVKIKEQADQIAKHEAEISRLRDELSKTNRENTAQAGFEQTQREVKKSERGNKGSKRVVDVGKQRQNIVEGMKEHIANGGSVTDLYSFVQKLSENIHREAIQKGETITRQGVTEKIHNILTKDVGLDIPKEFTGNEGVANTQDLISGIGRSTPLTTDPVKLAKMETREQLQKVGKINRYLQKLAAPFTGSKRKPSSAESRALEKEGRELAKKMGVQVTDPATQLKNSLEATKTRLRNEIADLNRAIALREPLIPKTGRVQLDAEAESLKAQRDAKKLEYTQVFGDPSLSDEARLKIALGAAMRSETLWTHRLADAKKGIFDKAQPDRKVTSPELEAIRARVDASKAAVKELRDQDANIIAGKEAAATASKQKALQKQIDELQKRVAGRDIGPKGKPVNRPAAPELEPLLQQRDALNAQLAEMRKKPQVEKIIRTPEEIALQSAKTRIANRNADLLDKIASHNFDKPPPRKTIVPDEELRYHQTLNEQLKTSLNQERQRVIDTYKPRWMKVMEQVAGVARASALSGYHTLVKLGSYDLAKIGEAPMMETAGAALSKTPGLRGIFAKANLESGSTLSALGKFYSGMAGKGIKEAWRVLRTGGTESQFLYGKQRPTAPRWYDFFGRMHMVEKAPLLTGTEAMYRQRAYRNAIRDGLDPNDEFVKGAINKAVFDHSQKAILQENNLFADAVNLFHARLEKANPATGQPNISNITISTIVKTLLTKGIVRTPANYFAQTLARTPLGLASGLLRAGMANYRGIGNLHPIEANAVSALLKTGAVGSAFFILGAIDATKKPEDRTFGGYWEPGRKRGTADVEWGKLRIGGVTLPHIVTHNPLTESAQMGSTMMRVALSRRRQSDPDPQGITAGSVKAVIGLVGKAPVASPVMRLDQSGTNVTGDLLKGLVPQLLQNIADDTGMSAAIPAAGTVQSTAGQMR